MTREQAKSELMQIYMSLSEEKKKALDVVMTQTDGEYIRRSDVIKAVDKHTIDTSEIVLDEDITVILEELPSVAIPSAEPKWIPVTEQLPNDEEEVLFCDLFGDVMLGYHPKDWKRTHFAERGSWELQKNVVAWMLLPKPYEPQEGSE